MFDQLTPRAQATAFAVITMGLCTGLSVAMRSTGQAAAVAAMLVPLAAVMIMQFVVTRDGYHREGWRRLGIHRLGLAFWPLAAGIPIAVLAGSEATVGLSGLTRFHASALPGPGELVPDLLVLMAFAFFEEIGWRGYLLPLVGRGGPAASFGVGFLHGLYHLPVVFLVPGAYLTEGNRWLTVPIFLAVLTLAGGIYGWLRTCSGSVWPVVVTHAVFDLGLGVVEDAWRTTSRSAAGAVALIGRETGLATLALLALVAALLLARWPAGARPEDAGAGLGVDLGAGLGADLGAGRAVHAGRA